MTVAAFFAVTFFLGASVSFLYGYMYSITAAYIVGAVLLLLCAVSFFAAFLGRKRKSPSPFSGNVADELNKIDEMSGLEFEEYAACLFSEIGYENVTVTASSHDQGADILMERDGVRFAVQCKVYSTRLGNTPVQEITAAREFYGCHVGAVITNSYFTDSAAELAKANRVLLWDRAYLAGLIDKNM